MNVSVGSRIGGKSGRSGELLAQKLMNEGISDQRVLRAIAQSPRHIFVPEILAHKAYDNTALPIGQGQTISQPYIVAKMSELLLADGVPESLLRNRHRLWLSNLYSRAIRLIMCIQSSELSHCSGKQSVAYGQWIYTTFP